MTTVDDFADRLRATLAEARDALSGRDSFRRPASELVREQKEHEREQRLWRIGGVITEPMARAIVTGRLPDTPALAMVRAFMDAGPPSARDQPMLCLYGESSRGKTVAAVWAIANYGGVYVSAHELKRLKRGFTERDAEEYRYTLASKLVVLDDLGVERMTDEDEEMLFAFVNGRQRGSLTIITTNLGMPELTRRYGGRTMKRLSQVARFEHATGLDLRTPAANENR